jgi:hypothetical protein
VIFKSDDFLEEIIIVGTEHLQVLQVSGTNEIQSYSGSLLQ